MTDTNGSNPEYEDFDYTLYVERESRLIFQVQFFEDFVMVRPASPTLYQHLRRLSLSQFCNDFDEFCGDPEQVYEFLRGGGNIEVEVDYP